MVNSLISIIVPVFNAKNYLVITVDSVLEQSYADFELIFVNDGSVDGSLEFLQEIQKKDSRIKVYSQENKGVTAARKLGWLKSKGDYITFLDADDSFFENSIEVLMQHAKEGGFDIVNGSFISVPSGRTWENNFIGEMTKNDYLKSLIFGETYGVLYASIYKKEIFKESTFSFDHSIKVGEDVLMNIELCGRVSKVKNIEDLVYKYTDDNNSSAMKIIVRHPFYYKKFNKIRDSLIQNIDPIFFNEIQKGLVPEDNFTIINAFFSPLIRFNPESYYFVKELRKNTIKTNIYTRVLSHIYITILTKQCLLLLFLSKNFILRRDYSNKKVLY